MATKEEEIQKRVNWMISIKESLPPESRDKLYNDWIEGAKNGNHDSAINPLILAALEIKNQRPIPEPIASYIVNIFKDVVTAAIPPEEPNSKKRATEIVRALNLQRNPHAKKQTPEGIKRINARRDAAVYMYEQVAYSNDTVNTAAQKALSKFSETGMTSVDAFVKMFRAAAKPKSDSDILAILVDSALEKK